jgi:hypothetical protein
MLAAVLAGVVSLAHVGSPDTFFTGRAGPYPVQVTARLPGVIPGLAQISVRIPGTPPGSGLRVTAQAIQWNLGEQGAPPPDVAAPVSGDPELFATALWFMLPTSYRVHVVVDGPAGTGTAIVPVMAIATAARPMPRGLGVLLAGLGVFLGVGLITIVGAAARESVLAPGALPDRTRRRRARIAMTCWAVLVILAVVGGRAWWNAEALAYAESVLFRPFASNAALAQRDGRPVLTLAIDDPRWPPRGNAVTRYNALLADHGKLMHMFLLREPQLDVFAHVHPAARQPAAAFDLDLPPLPAGRYRVYGDIVHESGYAQTLVAAVDLPDLRGSGAAAAPRDPDDSWFDGPAAAEQTLTTFRADDGTTIAWERGEVLRAGVERVLRFSVRDPDGSASLLEPYMGMIGHVAVARAEGDVFAHLHPSGSVSMAALQRFANAHALHEPAGVPGQLSTLYAFPKPGRYRMWAQVKRAGRIVTAGFDVAVQP